MNTPEPLDVTTVTLSKPSPDASLLDISALRGTLDAGASPVECLKQALEHAGAKLDDRFKNNDDIESIVRGRAWVVDQILILA